jgi:hypothetical protein
LNYIEKNYSSARRKEAVRRVHPAAFFSCTKHS